MTDLFSQAELQAIAQALGDTEVGLKGSEIAMLIKHCGMVDPGGITKRHRIYDAFAQSQNSRKDRTRVLGFRNAMAPARYIGEPHRLERKRGLDAALSG